MSGTAMIKERYYSIDEIAELLDFNRKTVVKWINDGELVASRLGREYRIRQSDLDDFMRRKQIKPKI
jgi:excisionase family DNA binding protein